MSAKILHAVHNQSGYHLLVHLDTAMTVEPHEAHDLGLAVGSPHPHFVKTYYWPQRTPGIHQQYGKDMTDAEYLAHIEEMVMQQTELDRQGIRFYQPAPPPHEIVDELHGKEF